jgi:sortase A
MAVRPEHKTDSQDLGLPLAGGGRNREVPLADGGRELAAFYDRRAPAALAYCARLCAPEAIADAVEDAFGRVFSAAATEALGEEELERRLRTAVRTAAAERAPAPAAHGPGTRRLFERGTPDPWRETCELTPRLLAGRAQGELSPADDDGLHEHLRRCRHCRRVERRFAAAERAYDALAGDDAPALGRSLLAQMIEAAPPSVALDWGPAAPVEEPAVAPEPPVEAARPDPAVASVETADFPAARRRRLPLPRVAPGWRRRLAILLAVVGALLLSEAVVTLAWKEPFTAYLAARAQDHLKKDLDKLDHERVALAADQTKSLAAIRDAAARSRRRMSFLAARLDGNVQPGEALGRIQIDRIGIDYVFVQGTDSASLRKGPGHYHPETALPGQGGPVAIAGHRTSYEAPFREIDSLEAGDRITVRMPYGLFTYEVTGHRIVPADDRAALLHGTGERLVLSACTPLYSATDRILVDAKLVGSQPLGAAIESSVPAPPAVPAEVVARRRTAHRLELLGHRQLGPGTSGPDVRELQRLLGMPVTGVFDANTSAAVLAFQRDHGLPQVGVVGSQTKRALARRPHPPSRPPTPATVPQQQPTGPNATGQGQQPYGTGQGQTTTPGGYGTQGRGTYTAPQAPARGGSGNRR